MNTPAPREELNTQRTEYGQTRPDMTEAVHPELNQNYTQTELTTLPVPTPKPEKKNPDAIGGFSTEILDFDKSRVKNMRLAADLVTGHIIQPGEIFSFNKVVGPRISERGFEKARILIKGKKAYGDGGGVCQISSTLYNAAKDAGLDIIERHTHSNDVHYLPPGRDAAVNTGSKDMRFKNTKSYPIKLVISVGNGKVIATILKVTEK